ncbi:chitooligosaccharide deacetylase [Gordoniibacillus kamchatkensis]|uniref:Chitooligosaccharide deacetylase n=1 Tax=Gordoniibacillus kamchatkensis TaxID=1590651 RepID=A0ABR5AFQ5_9BACL|nr:polysaccharide deacetylase family protein [Paenibacillus sp. VKM B-2647]KIL39885.1 chitooligosaccharide deacetylase [Paenibacillus sp. VKM B-2647]
MNKRLYMSVGIAVVLLTACSGTRAPSAGQGAQQSPGTPGAPGTVTAQSAAQTPNLAAGPEKTVRKPEPLTLAELHQKYRSTFLFNGPSSKRQVALTFDDVPDTKFTPQVLDVLKKYGVKATFFAMGSRAAAHPEIVKRIVQEGHVIGNHTYSHPNLPKVSDDVFHNEVLGTERILADLAGYSPRLFRPPYGNINEGQIQWLASQHFYITNWNVDSLDWEGLNAKQVMSNVLGHVGAGSVVLQHGAGGTGEDLTGTVQALPRIIESLQSKGIRLVTLPELFDIPKSK